MAALCWVLLGTPPAAAEPAHGIAMHGEPALGPGFAHLPYADPNAQPGGMMVLGEVGGFDSLNPFILKGRAPWVISSYTVETLLARSWDEPFSLYGLLAESIEVPPDRAWVEFTLRPEARFSDGTPVGVEDVIWSFETLGTEGHPRYRAAWNAVETIEPVGERSLRIAFSEPNRELPLIMGLRPVLKKAEWDGRRFGRASGLDPVTGSGPYVVEEAEAGRRLTLRRNPDWWGKGLAVNRGLYAPDRIRVDYFLNGDALWTAVKTGAITLFPDRDPVRWAEGYAGLEGADGPLIRHALPHGRPTGMEGFVFNTRRGVFADRAVRQAMTLAFDWTWINQRLYAGQYERIESYWHNSELAFDGPAEGVEAQLLAPYMASRPDDARSDTWRPPPGDGQRNRRNLRRAAAMLDAAGWRLAPGERVRRRDGETLSFEILVASSDHETVASIWSEALARLGAEARVRRVDSAQYEARRREYDYDVTVNRWYLSLSPGTEQWLYFGSDGRTEPGTRNYMGVADPAVDGMIRALVETADRERFVATARALDRLLSDGVYVVPFGVLPRDRVAALKGWRRPETGALYGFRPEVWWKAE